MGYHSVPNDQAVVNGKDLGILYSQIEHLTSTRIFDIRNDVSMSSLIPNTLSQLREILFNHIHVSLKTTPVNSGTYIPSLT